MNLIKQLSQEIVHIATNPKVATGVAIGTTSSGVGTWLDWIPSDIGKLAAFLGAILTIVLIAVNIAMLTKTRLEISILREKEKKRRVTDDIHDKSSS